MKTVDEELAEFCQGRMEQIERAMADGHTFSCGTHMAFTVMTSGKCICDRKLFNPFPTLRPYTNWWYNSMIKHKQLKYVNFIPKVYTDANPSLSKS